ncbi:MAG: trigger factor [Prevotellaceae bacterium]|nr:trigger factor [Prevotellaceae bacterium]
MNIKFEKTGDVSARLALEIEKADYADAVKKQLKNISGRAQMPGFRPGHVPFGLIQKRYGTEVKAEEVNKLLQKHLTEYIRENHVNMLGEPLAAEDQQPVDIEKDETMTFVFDIALAPEFDAQMTGHDKLPYYRVEVSAEDVEQQVTQLRQSMGHPESVDTYADRDIVRGTLAELDAEGKPAEGGIVIETASVMPTYFKNDDEKTLFANAAKGGLVIFNPSKAYEGSDAEIASLLKISKEDVAAHTGNFSLQISEISRFVPAELNQELFDKAFGEGNVKSEEELRARISENLAKAHEADSDYKFLLDVRAHMEKKVGKLTFPDALLRKIMLANNKDKGEAFVDENYAKSIEELKWHLIKEKLVKAADIKVDDSDVKTQAVAAARYQFAQYGINNIPDEYLENYAQEMLKKQEQVNMLVERAIDSKLVRALKDKVKLDEKTLSKEDFGKLFE